MQNVTAILKQHTSMKKLPNFDIKPHGEISRAFLRQNILTFHRATEYIQNLSYGRNSNKEDLKSIFIEKKGTCSTKHAVLKQLANENDFKNIQLILGIFKMNPHNTPKVQKTLLENNLKYIPEAHNYLKYENEIFDYTKQNSSSAGFVNDLLFETEIQPNEINNFKIQIHKDYLINWLNENNNINYSLDELWKIREQCIEDLSK
ncbi:hypothetical protein [Paenimyroides aestuarii]|uniref:Uncharacterized protein n=1 Tax=Paenimyroides aestuarii TaxID=2968490 RepID=A0ABY5NVF9_9FLAO|nr:hypothetical protein [Paenimyroides aestuarii]UUV22571.1 hypothetical protein NPX36_05890 [Paenimyroides aestuarii]